MDNLKNKMVEWFECHPMVLLENEAREIKY